MTTNDGDWLVNGFANEDVDDNCWIEARKCFR
jgi:hypothetical protein